jgi:hypothetical protein
LSGGNQIDKTRTLNKSNSQTVINKGNKGVNPMVNAFKTLVGTNVGKRPSSAKSSVSRKSVSKE